MPAPTRKPVTKVEAPDTIGRPQRSAVVAQPVNMGMPSGKGGEMDSLLKGLSQFNANLSNYVEENARRDIEEGMQSAADGSPLTDDKGDWYRHGHLQMQGRVAGQRDAADMLSKYDTEFDKDAGDVEQFMSKQWAERTKGLSDKSYLSGYARSFLGSIEQLRKGHLEYQTRRISETNEANATQLIHDTVKPFIAEGREIPQEKVEELKAELSSYGIGRGRFNELLLVVADREGMEGNFGIYDMLKRPNSDGTPGPYFIPKNKERIDAAQVRAQNVFLAKQSQATELARKAREDRQDAALYSVFERLYTGDSIGAQAEFNDHVQHGLFSRASEIVSWSEKFRRVENRELAPGEQGVMTEGLYDIYTGRITRPQDVLKLGLPPQQTRQLLTELRTVQVQERQAATDQRAQADQPFKAHAYREQEDWIETVLKPQRGLLDKFTEKDLFLDGARATAKLELAEYVRANGLKDIRTKAVEIVERHQKRVADFEAARLDTAAARLRYSSLRDATAAYERRQMSDVDFDLHLEYFEAQAKRRRVKESRKQ